MRKGHFAASENMARDVTFSSFPTLTDAF
jgi:hypothetical protein